jgi:PAS domain S-box-containing protein
MFGPLLWWVARRASESRAVLAILGVVGVTMWQTASERGVFGADALGAQLFLGANAIGFLLLGGYREARGPKPAEAGDIGDHRALIVLAPFMLFAASAWTTWRATTPDDVPWLREIAPFGLVALFASGALYLLTGRLLDRVAEVEAARRDARQSRLQAYLLDLGDALREIDDPAVAVDAGLSRIAAHVGVSQAVFGEIDLSGRLSVRRWTAATGGAMTVLRPLSDIAPDIMSGLARGEVAAFEDGHADPRIGKDGRAALNELGVRAFIVAPLIKGGRLVATLLLYTKEPRAWSPADIAAVTETAARVWASVQRTRAETALRRTLNVLEGVLSAAPASIYMFNNDTQENELLNSWARRLLGYEDAAWAEIWPRTKSLIHPDDFIRLQDHLKALTDASGPEPLDFEYRMRHASGGWRWFMSRDIAFERRADGSALKVLGVAVDITERRAAEEALRLSEQRLRLAGEAAAFGVYDFDVARQEAVWTEGMARLAGVTVEGTVRPAFVHTLMHPDDRQAAATAMESFQCRPGPYAVEFRIVRPDGEVVSVLDRGEAIGPLGPDGRVQRVIGTVIDITERKRAEERIQLLMREVNHRSKNLLALVQAVARLTVANSPQEFLTRFEERIRALAASQDLLVRDGWSGVPLEALIRSQLAHFADLIGARIHLEGPPVEVNAQAAQALGMAIHELATNAGKYGALANAAGVVRVTWSLQAQAGGAPLLSMAWVERGGPPVTKPSRRGFGSTVIETMAKLSLGATIELDFAPEGFSWRLECAGGQAIAARREREAGRASAPSASRAARILVVEDEALVALEAAAALERAGYAVLGPVASLAPAMAILDREGCDGAVLDIDLGGETSEPLAQRLQAAGVPFVTMSGAPRDLQPSIFRAGPFLAKPVTGQTLVAALKRHLAHEHA